MSLEILRFRGINKITEKRLSDDAKVAIFILCAFVISRIIMFWECNVVTEVASFTETINKFSLWDAEWYGYLVELFRTGDFVGTRTNGQAAWAFFPLYPFIVYCFHRLFWGVEVNVIGSVLRSVFFMLSEYYAYKYIMLTRNDRRIAYFFIFFMSFGPYSFYFSILYTEALFVMLLVMSFYYMVKRNYIVMGITGALLSTTRNAGVFFVFVILVYQLMCFASEKEKRSIKDYIGFPKYVLQQEKLVLGTSIVPMGLFAYMLFLHLKLGDGLAFVHVQYAWGRDSVGVFKNLFDSVIEKFPPDYLGMTLLASILLIVYFFFSKHNYYELIYPTIIIYLGASSALMSIPRFMLGSFVPLLCFSERLSKFRAWYVKITICGLAFMFELVLIREWLEKNTLLF